ncbi:MAG TPA: hypothetical protein VE526_08825 [Solirubrobacteraceae bacterium]|jgi:hypothetical protein|nr:hypothetical protein [Solirubrobacteraceae bacterium]
MPAQTRVPGAASSEVDFELERFEFSAAERIEIAGRWFGLRGRRFVRPVLNLTTTTGARRRAIALLEHKPWAAADGETWLAAFAWPPGAGDVERAELEVGPGLMVELPAPGSVPAGAGRVSAMRPPAPPPASLAPAPDGAVAAVPAVASPPSATPRRDAINAAQAERDEAIAARDAAEADRVTALNERDDALSRRDAALRDVDRAVGEREEAEAERDRLRAEIDRITRERDHAHAERNRMMQDAEAVARERDQAAAERDAARAELSRAIPARDEAIRERDAEAARAAQAQSERDVALAERKSAVAQRDRARRERDRAMRAVGVEPPDEPADLPVDPVDADPGGDTEVATPPQRVVPAAGGVALPSRPLKRIGGTSAGPAPEAKPLLTPVDSSRPRRLSRSRPAPSGAARWAVRITVMALLLVLAVVVALGAISLL